ncbi:MAG: tRNA wybutosine-synthesizing 3 family protein [Nanoarchaeota archaeon]
MDFDTEKKKYLDKLFKPDHSKKGEVDKEIIPLLDAINARKGYYTTSSCAGRIVILEKDDAGKRKDCRWLFVSHLPVADAREVSAVLQHPGTKQAWLKMESFIVHICARDIGAAKRLLEMARICGLKRAGIVSFSERIIIEVIGNEAMELLIAEKGKLLVTDEYLERTISAANAKLKRNAEKMEEFRRVVLQSRELFMP